MKRKSIFFTVLVLSLLLILVVVLICVSNKKINVTDVQCSSTLENLKVSVVNVNNKEKEFEITIKIENNSQSTISFGTQFEVYNLEGNQRIKCEDPNIGWDDVLITTKPQKPYIMKFTLSDDYAVNQKGDFYIEKAIKSQESNEDHLIVVQFKVN